jgi:selenocysteine lyase/cysteine desulfurase
MEELFELMTAVNECHMAVMESIMQYQRDVMGLYNDGSFGTRSNTVESSEAARDTVAGLFDCSPRF